MAAALRRSTRREKWRYDLHSMLANETISSLHRHGHKHIAISRNIIYLLLHDAG